MNNFKKPDSFTDLLTISMPVYNRKEFFVRALESALNQTVKCKVIVIDNCSPHNYFESVCREKKVQYFRNETNIGIAGNFARGFELSKTKYTLNLQDDDVLSPLYVESFVNAVTLHPDIDVFFSDFVIMTTKGELPHSHILPFGYMEKGEKIIEYGIKYKLGFPYMSSAIKSSKAHTVNEAKGWIGSYDWEWIYLNAGNLTFYGDSRKLYNYRIHGNQITSNDHSSFTLSIPYIYDKVLKENVKDDRLKEIASKNAFWELIRLKSELNRAKLEAIMKGESKYNKYLKEKLEENVILKFIYWFPRAWVCFIFKVLGKLKLAG